MSVSTPTTRRPGPYAVAATEAQINAAIAKEIDADQLGRPITAERLDNFDQQRIGQLAGDVINHLLLAAEAGDHSWPITALRTGVVVDHIAVDDSYDGEGLLDGLAITAYQKVAFDGQTHYDRAGTERISNLRRSSDLGGHAVAADQIGAFVLTVLRTAAHRLNKQARFFAAVSAAAEPDRTALPAYRLNDACTLVGETDGYSAVYDNLGTDDRGRQQIRTEHGLLLLDPEADVLVTDEPGIPSYDPPTCAHQTYAETLETPAEYCENLAEPGSQYCDEHNPDR